MLTTVHYRFISKKADENNSSTITMKSTIFKEINRKLFHLTGLAIPIGYYLISDKKTTIIVMIIVNAVYFSIEILRRVDPRFEKLFLLNFADIMRPEEQKTITATGYFLISSLITIALFGKTVAILSLLFLILGDSIAAVVGKSLGRIKIYSKTLEGSLACLTVCFLIAMIAKLNPYIALIGAFTATVVEFISVGGYDNFTIPLASGFVMQILIDPSRFF